MNSDFTYKYKGKSKIAITPRSTKQVSDALRILNKYRIPIVPQVNDRIFHKNKLGR